LGGEWLLRHRRFVFAMGRRGGFELGFWGGLDRGILIDHHKFSHTPPMEYNKWRFGVGSVGKTTWSGVMGVGAWRGLGADNWEERGRGIGRRVFIGREMGGGERGDQGERRGRGRDRENSDKVWDEGMGRSRDR
jgi:hypothetical protein